jgi:hypothetical protein
VGHVFDDLDGQDPVFGSGGFDWRFHDEGESEYFDFGYPPPLGGEAIH